MSRNAINRVCCTCLSTDRNLLQLGGIVDGVKLLFMLLAHDTVAYKEGKDIASLNVCWECSAVIQRIKKFQTQARAVQKQLVSIADGRKVKLQTYSRLSKSHNTTFQYEFQYDDISENVSECGTDMEPEYVDDDFDDEPLNIPDIKNEPSRIENDATKIDNDSTDIENDATEIKSDVTDIKSDITDIGNDAIVFGHDGIEVEVEAIEYENDAIEIENDGIEIENDAIEIENDSIEIGNDAVEIENEAIEIDAVEIGNDALEIGNDYNEIGNYLVVKKSSTIELETAQNKPKNETKDVIKTSESDDKTIKKCVRTRRSKNKKEPRPRGRPKLADDIQYPCFECDAVFKNGKMRYRHTKIKHSEWLTCATCGKRFAFKANLEKHESLHRGPLPREECATCHKMIRRDLMRAHLVTHRATQAYSCVQCDKIFKSKLTYDNHMKYTQTHATDVSKHKCPVCPKEYWARGDLRDHINFVHKGETDFNCHLCGKGLANKKSLNRHIRETHEGSMDRKKICQQCGRTFRSKKTLLEHELTHTGERPLACGECGKSFRQRSALYNHMRLMHAPRERRSVSPA